MANDQPFSFTDSIREARQRVASEFRAQADQIQKLNLELTELQQLHDRTEQEANRQWDEIARVAADVNSAALAAAATGAQASAQTALENVLGAVRALMTCTIPEQVLTVLTEEASQWGVRAAIFDVRGKAAWGASAHGFGPALSEKVMHGLIVPLNQDNPFRKVCETAGHVDASADTLKKNRNVLDKFKPAPHAPILLLPIRSAGTVAAIFYADPGEKDDPLPVNALMILAEFAGAQIDRLIALSGGFSNDEAGALVEEPSAHEAPAEEPVWKSSRRNPRNIPSWKLCAQNRRPKNRQNLPRSNPRRLKPRPTTMSVPRNLRPSPRLSNLTPRSRCEQSLSTRRRRWRSLPSTSQLSGRCRARCTRQSLNLSP